MRIVTAGVTFNHNTLLVVGVLLFSLGEVYAEIRTITADVTGDNMYDAIKITDNAVYVVDKMLCCTKQRFPIISGCDSIFDVLVDDFSSINRSNEVAIVFDTKSTHTTVVYAFRGGAFSRVSDNLPGMIFSQNNVLCIHKNYLLDSIEVTLPWPVMEEQGFLKPAVLSNTIDTCMTIEPGAVLDDTLTLPAKTCIVIAIRKQEFGGAVSLYDLKGDIIADDTRSDPALISVLTASIADQVVLHIDNRRSVEPGRLQYHRYFFSLPY